MNKHRHEERNSKYSINRSDYFYYFKVSQLCFILQKFNTFLSDQFKCLIFGHLIVRNKLKNIYISVFTTKKKYKYKKNQKRK